MDRNPTSTVFIGNIPYDVTEQMLTDMFSQAGPIKALRMVTDKDTGKPKGYGFCEYHDVQTAQSAVRNLNKYEVNGRMLRVDFADEHSSSSRDKRDKTTTEPRGGRGAAADHTLGPGPPPGTRPIGRDAAGAAATVMNGLLGNAPYTGPSQDKISTVIAGMSAMQLYEILSQMRTLCAQNHAAARSILVSNPQLTKALFQAQVLLGMVKGAAPPPPTVVAAPLPAPPPLQAAGPPPGPPVVMGPMVSAAQPLMAPPQGAPGPAQQPIPPPYGTAPGPYGPTPGAPPQPQPMVGGMAGPMLLDPGTGVPYGAPPPGQVLLPPGQPQPAPAQPGQLLPAQPQAPATLMQPLQPQPPQQQQAVQAQPLAVQPVPGAPQEPNMPPGGAGGAAVPLPASLAPQQAQVLQQVLSLTPAQIDALPPAQRQQVLMVRQQLGLGAPPQ